MSPDSTVPQRTPHRDDDKEPSMNRAAAHFGIRGLAISALLVGLNACSAADTIQDETLTSADETATMADAITASYPVGTTLATTANLNLRTGASTGYGVILVMPNGAHVTTTESAPRSGFYHVQYGSHQGWAYGGYLRVVSTGGGSTGGGSTGGGSTGGGSTAVDQAMARARAGVGFSYWWGEGRWLMSGPTSSTRGVCSGSCPSCSHSGSYGADCSGYVAKIWGVPGSNSDVSVNSHPYSTYNFRYTDGGGQWRQISRSSLQRGDAMVYHSGGEGHVFLFDSGDPWGSMWTYEARGCSYGIVHNIRTASSSYAAIRRSGF
jgi:uncharacterized protein YraI